MPNKNNVTIEGHLGRDPELRYTTSSIAVCSFSVAITERYGKGDDKKEKTTWVDVKAWRDTAEVVSEHFRKGFAIHVEGKLDVEEWEDKQTSQKRSKVVIVASSVAMPLWKKKEQAGQPKAAPPSAAQSEPEADNSVPF